MYYVCILSLTKGGKTMGNKSKRFQENAMDTPGPGTYSLSHKKDWIKDTHRKSASAPSVYDGAKGKSGGNVRSCYLMI